MARVTLTRQLKDSREGWLNAMRELHSRDYEVRQVLSDKLEPTWGPSCFTTLQWARMAVERIEMLELQLRKEKEPV